MAIEKMKKLTLMAVSAQKEAILNELMLQGCVEISEPSANPEDEALARLKRGDAAGISQLRQRQGALATAVRLLNQYAPEKKGLLTPLPEVGLESVLDDSKAPECVELAEKIIELDDEIRRLTTEESRLRSDAETLSPWKSLDMPLSSAGTETTAVYTASFPAATDPDAPAAALRQADLKAELFPVSKDENLRYVALVCYRQDVEAAVAALRPFGYSVMSITNADTAAQAIAKDERKLVECAQKKESLAARIAEFAPSRLDLKLCAENLTTRIEKADAASRLLCTGSAFMLQGWVVAAREEKLAAALEKYDCAWETADPDPDKPEEVPIKLRSNRLTRPYTLITEMYSLPAYNGLDPNPFIMPGFALFFGIMFADMAYGLIMLIAGLLITFKARPRGGMKYMAGLLIQCGISTFIMGFLTGSFFGDAVSVVGTIFGKTWTLVPVFGAIHIGDISISLPLNLLEGNNPLYVLIAAMCIGVVHLALGVGIGVYLKIKDGQWLDAVLNDVSWWVMFVGLGLMILGKGRVVLYVGIAMMLVGAFLSGKGFGRITGVFGAVYNGVTGYLGDILSYSRLMALMLAGSVIASVFNQLGSLGGIWLFIPVFIIGHALNFGLNIIGCFVHTMRLQFLEFFGKWYRDGGRPFRPLAINTKYVDIKEEN